MLVHVWGDDRDVPIPRRRLGELGGAVQCLQLLGAMKSFQGRLPPLTSELLNPLASIGMSPLAPPEDIQQALSYAA